MIKKQNVSTTIVLDVVAPEPGQQQPAAPATTQTTQNVLEDAATSSQPLERDGASQKEETSEEESEQDLVQRAKQEPEAFGELYQRYVKRIYNYHYQHTGSQIDAEDLTSRTFYRALRGLHRYKYKGVPFQAWLFRIAHNLVVNWYRDKSRHKVVSLDVAAPNLHSQQGEPQKKLLEFEKHKSLNRLISQLPEIRKTLLILKFVEQMSNAEIGKVLGKSEGAIKSLYHRTLLKLRQSVQEGEFDALI